MVKSELNKLLQVAAVNPFRNLTEIGRFVFNQENGKNMLYMWDWGPNAGFEIKHC